MDGRSSAHLKGREPGGRTPGRATRVNLRFIAIAAAILVIAGSLIETPFSEKAGASRDERPNIIIIMTDDQRTNMSAMPKTNELLKDRGTVYTNAFVSTPNCCPSRSTMFTGRYSHNHGVENNQLAYMLDHSTTLQRYLQQSGYRTGLFGKFLNKWHTRDDPPYFDRWAIHKHRTGVYYNGRYSDNGHMKTVKRYGTGYLSDRAVEFLQNSERTDSVPWLMYVTPNAPHEPAQPERSYKHAAVEPWVPNPAVHESDLSDKPPYVQSKKTSMREIQKLRLNQMRSVMSVDDMVARIFRTLRTLDETRETIAIFTSDNGYFWGEHGLRGKWLPYEPAIHVPLIVRWPGHVAEGAQDDRLVVNVDIAPTILDAVGMNETAVPMDGRSLLDESWDRSKVLLEYLSRKPRGRLTEVPTWKGIRTKSAAYTEYYDSNGAVTFREYYDLVEDPYELENLLADDDITNDAPAAALQVELLRDMNCRGTACP